MPCPFNWLNVDVHYQLKNIVFLFVFFFICLLALSQFPFKCNKRRKKSNRKRLTIARNSTFIVHLMRWSVFTVRCIQTPLNYFVLNDVTSEPIRFFIKQNTEQFDLAWLYVCTYTLTMHLCRFVSFGRGIYLRNCVQNLVNKPLNSHH